MRHEIIHLNSEYALEYDPILEGLIPAFEDNNITPKRAMLVIPGGGYFYTSSREADPIAAAFIAKGYVTFILHYTCANNGNPRYPTPHTEVMAAMDYIRKNAKEYNINPDKICLVGFSAGGHLAASYGYAYKNQNVLNRMGLDVTNLKPNALILSYPVITTGEYTHQGTADNVSGGDEDIRRYMSVENHIDDDYPMTFAWCTLTDQAVPAKNTQLLEEQLIKHNIIHEVVYYPNGPHGLSLANEATDTNNPDMNVKEVQNWVDLANEFILKNLGR